MHTVITCSIVLIVCFIPRLTSAEPTKLTIATVFPHGNVQHRMAWHIRGYLLGFKELENQLADRINVTHKFIWEKNVSQCADIAARVVVWASKLYYSAKKDNEALIFCSPGNLVSYLT